ncbi:MULTISPECIES: tripartite tricarboxylate transporter TctB family protein [unclassified Dinoroseobacter]|uniref:tripartite tricarboxylate transporter TctB family protein n=1 Tax=unclassified Dinoroseobacter TaxID=2620028 RepID=UPI003C7CF00B
MLKAESLIAMALMGLSGYFMIHALVLPIGWVEYEGPGGGAFPFWLSGIMLLTSAAILLRSLRSEAPEEPFFDPETRRAVLAVSISLVVTIALLPVVGAYVAIPLFMIWYLRIYGGHGWKLTAILTLSVPVFLFFFFEVTLKILLPKGVTEPLFLPLYAAFF